MQEVQVSEKIIGRLTLYRRLLLPEQEQGRQSIFSHQIASLAKVSPAQVRRDIMATGYSGNPSRGYEIRHLVEAIHHLMDDQIAHNVALVGLGHLGRAVATFFHGLNPSLDIVAIFDADPAKSRGLFNGIPCFPVEAMDEVIAGKDILTAILAVPAAQAQGCADALVQAGVTGMLNFALTPLHVPRNVFLEEMDMSASLEKVAFYARKNAQAKRKRT